MAVVQCVYLSLTLCLWTVTALPMDKGQNIHHALTPVWHNVTGTRRAAEGEVRYPCGDGRCLCQGTHADCSNRNMSYIPQLPSDITSLDFSQNVFLELTDDDDDYENITSTSDLCTLAVISKVTLNVTNDFLVNITTVTWLNLSKNSISDIRSSAFQVLTHLTYLDVSYNKLTCDALSVVFNIPTLDALILAGVKHCDRLKDVVTSTGPRLQELYLHANNSSVLNRNLNMTLQSPVTGVHTTTNLTYLDLRDSSLSCDDVAALLTVPSIKVLNISNMGCSPDFGCDTFPDIGTGNPIYALEELNLERNFQYNILNLTHLLPFTRLKRLHLNQIETTKIMINTDLIIMYEALIQLTNLTYLDLSGNMLSCDDLWTVLNIPSLETLNLRQGTVCTTMWPRASLPSVNKPRLATLDLSHNDLHGMFISLYPTTLQYVDLSYSKIRAVSVLDTYSSLKTLNLRGNSLQSFIDTCADVNVSHLPPLLELDISENELKFLTDFDEEICLPQLHTLNMHKNKYTLFSDSIDIFLSSLKRLETLDISAGTIFEISNGSFNNLFLKSLNLAGNYLPITNDSFVDPDSFLGCSNLTNLSLANNDFVGISESRFQQLFSHLKHLRHLSLRSTRFSFMTVGMFRSLTSLQFLDLAQNSLALLPGAVFQSLSHLVSIDLSSNKIAVIQESAFTFVTRQRLQHIDLSFNPFTCSCDVLWFRKWLVNSPSVFTGSSSDYTCGNLPNTPVQSFFMQEQACLLSPETSKFIIATISLIFIVMSLLSFFYRYRWHIRLILHEVFRGPGERLRRLREQRYEYDVFVSYDKENFSWVRDYLMPSLEVDMGLKLCIHQRDFFLGYPIVENIMDTVHTSKKLLMLFSRTFARSQWCQFELQLCLTHAMDTQDVLIVVMLEDIPSRELTPAMMAVMKTTTYIEWADEADARESFWRRMGLALHEILPVA